MGLEQDTQDLDNQTHDVQESTGEKPLIEYPEDFPGDMGAWLVDKTRHLNKGFEEWFQKPLKSIEDNYRLFENKPIDGMMGGACMLPVVNSIIETNQSRFAGSLISREKFVDAIPKVPELMPTSPEQVEALGEKHQIVEDLTNEDIITTPELPDKIDELLKTLLLENLVVGQVYWDSEEYTDLMPIRDIDPMSGTPVIIGEEEKVGKKSRPNLMVHSIRSLAWDPREKFRIANSSWLRKRMMVSANELLRLEREGVIENAQYAIDKATKNETPNSTGAERDPDAKQSQTVEGTQLPAIGWDDGVYQLDEWWATLGYKNKEGQFVTGEYNFWIVGGECVVKFRPNPLKPQRKPFISCKLNRKPGMLLAQGPIDVIKGIVIQIANNMARIEKLVNRAANTPTYYEPSSGLDGRRAIYQENSLIPVISTKGILEGKVPVEALGMIEKFLTFLINQAREATAANEQAQGIGQGEDGTATEAQLLAQSGNMRFQYNADGVCNNFFAPLGREYYLFRKQFGQAGEMVIRDGGIDGMAVEVQPEDLQGDYDFRAIPSQSAGAKLKRFELLKGLLTELMTAQAQNPEIFTDKQGRVMQITGYEFLTEQMLPLVDVRASRGLFKAMDPMQQEQMRMAQAEQQAMGQAVEQAKAEREIAPPAENKPTVSPTETASV